MYKLARKLPYILLFVLMLVVLEVALVVIGYVGLRIMDRIGLIQVTLKLQVVLAIVCGLIGLAIAMILTKKEGFGEDYENLR